jgi:iron complex outermembrane receptor protein
VPETLSRFAIQSRFLNNWYAQFETNYIGRQYLSGDNANDKEKKSSYIISNLSSRIESGNWSFNARINNIFNKKYSQVDTLYGAINPASERNFLVTASYQF